MLPISPLFFVIGLVIMAVSAVSAVTRGFRQTSDVLVIKEWHASETPDTFGNYVTIRGRSSGIITWLLTIIGLDPTTTIKASQDKILFERASLSGMVKTLIPLTSVSSMVYGICRPWRKAIFVAILAMILTMFVGNIMLRSSGFRGYDHESSVNLILLSIFLGCAVGLIYYILNRFLTLGFIEHSGEKHFINFKRSVIEGQQITEDQSGWICELIEQLMESKRRVSA